MAARSFFAFLGLAALLVAPACDSSQDKPKTSLAEKDRAALLKKAQPIVDGHAAAFATVAGLLAAGEPTEQACPVEVAARLDGAPWADAPSIALSERALTWFVQSPAESTSDPQTEPPWAQGTEGMLNDEVLADRSRIGIDGARLWVLRELWLWMRHGPTQERLTAVLESQVVHKFTASDPPGPPFVVLVRDLAVVEPQLPTGPKKANPEAGSIEALKAEVKARDKQASPTLRIDAAAVAKRSFVGGTMSGWVEVYEVATGRRLCGHRVEAKSSERIQSPSSRDQAVPRDLAQEFVRAANAAFAHPVAALPPAD